MANFVHSLQSVFLSILIFIAGFIAWDKIISPMINSTTSATSERYPSTAAWRKTEACLQGLGLDRDDYWSEIGLDGRPHAKLSLDMAARLRAAGKLDAAKACVGGKNV